LNREIGTFNVIVTDGQASSGTTEAPTTSEVTFTIATADRVAGKTAVSVTVGFKSPSALPIGGKITLNYPSGFFAPSAAQPVPAGSTSVAIMTATSAAPGATSIVITTAVAGIAAGTTFTITLSGLTMGAATAGSATGIAVQIDTDPTASAGVSSGVINSATAQSSQVTAVAFVISTADRVAGKTAVSVTLFFTTTSALPVGGKITLNYLSDFFACDKMILNSSIVTPTL
jgi:hypothetical protein